MKSFDSIRIILVFLSTFDVLSSSAFTTTSVVVSFTVKRPITYIPISILPQRYQSRVETTTTSPTTLVRMESSNHPTTETNSHDDNSTPMMAPTAMSSKENYTSNTKILGPTELLLLQRQQMRQQGLRQDYGCTIKNDPYDYIRSVIWLLFKISNVIFPTLGVGLTIGLGLNLFCGLGYYYDTASHTLVIDTLEHIRFQNQFLNSL